MLTYLSVFLASGVAGLVQGVTGFGSGICMMMLFPTILPVLNASALSGTVSMGCNISLTWAFRKHIRKDLLILPAIVFVIASTAVLQYADRIDATLILKIFGGFLLALSLYFLFFSKHIHIKASVPAAVICSTLSGLAGGLFGIGGPPMVLYYLAASDEKEEYLGTIQAFFLLTGIFTLAMRLYKGYFTLEMVPMFLFGLLGILLGSALGKRIVDRINTDTLRLIVYIFLGLTGILNLFK